MVEQQLTITAEERSFLTEFLETALKDARIEEHRTRVPSFREHVLRREELIDGLLTKLNQTAV